MDNDIDYVCFQNEFGAASNWEERDQREGNLIHQKMLVNEKKYNYEDEHKSYPTKFVEKKI